MLSHRNNEVVNDLNDRNLVLLLRFMKKNKNYKKNNASQANFDQLNNTVECNNCRHLFSCF